MYKIANVTDRSGKIIKPERIGRLVYRPMIDECSDGERRCFAETVGRRQTLVTSPVLVDTYDPETRAIKVVTQNSVYEFEWIPEAAENEEEKDALL